MGKHTSLFSKCNFKAKSLTITSKIDFGAKKGDFENAGGVIPVLLLVTRLIELWL